MEDDNEPMLVLARSFDFLTWLLPVTNNFPKAHRHTYTQRLLDAAFNLRERLEMANHRSGRARYEQLRLADEELSKVRMYLRLALKWKWFNSGQYYHAAEMVETIGKLLGGWIKRTLKGMAR